MTQTKHTPKPLAYDEATGRIYYADGDVEPTIATVDLENTTPKQAKADGHLIVHCVNLHDELVDALRLLVRAVKERHDAAMTFHAGYAERLLAKATMEGTAA